MKVKILYSALVLILALSLEIAAAPHGEALAQPVQYWAQTYGGDGADYAYSARQTSDGGYIVAGSTSSFGAGGDDFGVLKLTSAGDIEWQKTYGGEGTDCAYSIEPTSDGGYIIAGKTNSFGAGDYDFWVLKLNSIGNIQWQKAYGAAGNDCAYSIQQTSDGGYITAGKTSSSGAGGDDFWVLKLDPSGNIYWQKTYGGGFNDCAYSIEETTEGGYIVAGKTESFGAGGSDFWVLKLYSNGNTEWQRAYGGDGDDCAYSVQQTSVGGYILAGKTNSFGAGDYDFWVLKLDPVGKIQWQRTYGGTEVDYASAVHLTSGERYILAGYTESFGAKGGDFWVLMLTPDGDLEWQKTCGGASLDSASSIQQTSDGGYIVAGRTASFGAAGGNFWLLKLDPNGLIGSECPLIGSSAAVSAATDAAGVDIEIAANATAVTPGVTAATPSNSSVSIEPQCSAISNYYWVRSYAGRNRDIASSVRQTSDGGYIVAGKTDSFGAGGDDAWVLKLDSTGAIQWQKAYGGGLDDCANSVQPTSDGGYIAAGWTATFGAGRGDFWVLKLYPDGNIQWQKAYGGGAADCAYSIQETADGGYIVSGVGSFGTGGDDFWVLKLDSTGEVQWQKSYGGNGQESACFIQETTDGGYILAGTSKSLGAGLRNCDFWLLKLGSSGNIQWQKGYGGSGDDRLYSVQETTDEGYIIAGTTNSFGTGINNYDFWVLKLGAEGNVQWQKSYGGGSDDYAYSAGQTFDGGYIVAGETKSFGAGNSDLWVLKLTPGGDLEWQKAYGSSGAEYANSIEQTSDGEYIAAGAATLPGAASSSFWVLRLLPSGLAGGECPLIGDSAAATTDTSATVSSTAILGFNIIAGVTDTVAVASNTSAATYQQCPVTLPYLRISPRQVSPDQPVSISIYIENQDDAPDSRLVPLYINDNREDSQTVDIPPHSIKNVVFTVAKKTPGTYAVSLEGQSEQFTVVGAPSPGGGLGSGGIVTIIVVAVALIVAIALISRKPRWE